MPDILLLDDDDDFTKLLKRSLEAHGHHVHVARTGKAAMQTLNTLKPTAVIVDGLLPDTDGVKWIERFRQAWPDTPAVLISAFGYAKDPKTYQKLTKDLRVGLIAQKPLDLERFCSDFAKLVPDEDMPLIEATPVEEDILEIADLEAEFGAELPARVAALRQAFHTFAEKGAADAYNEALHMAHRLHGSAGMYGFDKISEHAGQVEQALREMDPQVVGRADAMLLAGVGQILQQLG